MELDSTTKSNNDTVKTTVNVIMQEKETTTKSTNDVVFKNTTEMPTTPTTTTVEPRYSGFQGTGHLEPL